MQKLEDVIGTIRFHIHTRKPLLDNPDAERALHAALVLVRRYERALKFYADRRNWLDDEVLVADEEGLLTLPDRGATARWALGDDTPLAADEPAHVWRAPEAA